MSTLKDRGEGFESKFAYDEELRFKAEARRNRLLAHWAAEKLGVAVDEYADAVIAADLEESGSDDVLSKIESDFTAAGIEMDSQSLRSKLDEFMAQAISQIESE